MRSEGKRHEKRKITEVVATERDTTQGKEKRRENKRRRRRTGEPKEKRTQPEPSFAKILVARFQIVPNNIKEKERREVKENETKIGERNAKG